MKIYRKNIVNINDQPGNPEYFILPAGITLNKYQLLNTSPRYFDLTATEKSDEDFSKIVRIYKKPLSKEYNFISKESTRKEKLRIGLVYDNSVLLECINIINREHYKPNIPQGLFITISNDQELIGVIVFSKLAYTNPIGRKRFFSKEFDDEKKIKEYALRKIGWISRIAIQKKYQGQGYGKFFASHFVDLISDVFPNKKLFYIEVLTSWTLEDFKSKIDKKINNLRGAMLNTESDFLSKANYIRVDLEKPVIRNSKRGQNDFKQVIQYYYVKKVGK